MSAPFTHRRARRWIAELRGTTSRAADTAQAIDDALGMLGARELAEVSAELLDEDLRVGARVLEIVREDAGSRAVMEIGENVVDVVWIARGVYSGVRGSAA